MHYLTVAVLLVLPAFSQNREIVIDGNLDDHLWRNIAPEKLVSPTWDVSDVSGGQIRVVVAGRYLCVAARLPEPSGRFTARLTGRNPSWEEEDAFRILVGANIDFTDRIIQVNPLGGYSIEKAVHTSYRSQNIFPYADEWERSVLYRDADKFLVTASRLEKEWIVEAAIPLNQLSAPGSQKIYASLERIRARRAGSPPAALALA